MRKVEEKGDRVLEATREEREKQEGHDGPQQSCDLSEDSRIKCNRQLLHPATSIAPFLQEKQDLSLKLTPRRCKKKEGRGGRVSSLPKT